MYKSSMIRKTLALTLYTAWDSQKSENYFELGSKQSIFCDLTRNSAIEIMNIEMK